MYQKGKRMGTIRISLRPAKAARSVQVAGDFTKWQPVDMRHQLDGQYVAEVFARSGVHQYKFLIDGQWITDPDHSSWASNPYGTMNSVLNAEQQAG